VPAGHLPYWFTVSGCAARAARRCGPGPAGAGRAEPAGAPHGGEANYNNREALGRSRGGLTSKIHLLADSRCRPLARLTSAGQRHDSVAFLPLMGQLKVARWGPGRPRTRPGRVLGDKAYSAPRSAATCAAAGSRRPSPSPRTR